MCLKGNQKAWASLLRFHYSGNICCVTSVQVQGAVTGGPQSCCPQEAEGASVMHAGRRARLLQASDRSSQAPPLFTALLWGHGSRQPAHLPATLQSVTVQCSHPALPAAPAYLLLFFPFPPLYSFRKQLLNTYSLSGSREGTVNDLTGSLPPWDDRSLWSD